MKPDDNTAEIFRLLTEAEVLLSNSAIRKYRRQQFILASTLIAITLLFWLVTAIFLVWFVMLDVGERADDIVILTLFFSFSGTFIGLLSAYILGSSHTIEYLYAILARRFLAIKNIKDGNG